MLLSLRKTGHDIWNHVKQIWNQIYRFANEHQTAVFWGFAVLLRLAYDVMYVWAASPIYDYAGLVYRPSFIKYCISLAGYFAIFMALPKRENDVVSFLLHFQFVLTVAPMLTFYAFSGGSTKYMFAVFLCVLLQIIIVGNGKNLGSTIKIVGIRNYVTVMLGVVVVVSAIIPILYNGFAGLKVFDFGYIYEMREKATYPSGFGYIWSWVTKVIIPFAFIKKLQDKQYLKAVVLLFLQTFFYMESGQKIVLFLLPALAVLFFVSKTHHLIKILYLGFAVLSVITLLAYQLDKLGNGIGVTLDAIIGVRLIFHPADNKFNYFECFNELPKVFFSDGMVGKLLGLTYPYAGSLGQVVYAYIGGEFKSVNMNTGYLGESYAQMGYLGMISMSILLAFILKGVRYFSNEKVFPVIATLFSVYILYLNDGALFTNLFTGGMFIAFLLIVIYYGDKTEEVSNGIQCK